MADTETETEYLARESRLRHTADRMGLQLVKSRSRDRENPAWSTYGIVEDGVFVAGDSGSGFGLSLDDAERALNEDDERTGHRAIDVRLEPEHEARPFDDSFTPILTRARDPKHGEGWILRWFDDGEYDDYFLGGNVDDVDGAVKEAQRFIEVVSRSHVSDFWVGDRTGRPIRVPGQTPTAG